jgi:hypothetical protein
MRNVRAWATESGRRVTKMVACRLMAMAGMTANHQRRVRHHTTATATTHTPMMISVLPTCDQGAVTESQVWLRVS